MNKLSKIERNINDFLAETPNNILDNTNKLARMQDLADALGNPEKKLKVIHVAGTSGKTSTCYFIASLLKTAGIKTGLTVSPHVDTIRERAQIDLKLFSEEEWGKEISVFFEKVQKSGIRPSYFEFYMNFAFWLFHKKQVEYVVVETGLGGTWDGSNILNAQDKICVITDIGYDHTEILGETLLEIAGEKAGIIHENNQVFMHNQGKEVVDVIKKRTEQMHGQLHILDVPTKNFMGRNLALAKTVVNFALKRSGKLALNKSQIDRAKMVNIPARAELTKYSGKDIIMDGSHNPQKLTAFLEYLDQKYPSKSRSLIATLGTNKIDTLDESMKILCKISGNIILTSFKNESLETNKRASIDEDLLVAAAKRANFDSLTYVENPLAALKQAIHEPTEQIVITGSFYLLDHLRPTLLNDN